MADHTKLKSEGRNFSCASCPLAIQKIRRCREDRIDFSEKDGSIWPIYVQKGGQGFGFCPAKATWDSDAMGIYRLLSLAAETGTMYESGGLADQPAWWIDLAAWFMPRYRDFKVMSYAKAILGDGSSKGLASKGVTGGGKQR